MAQVRAPRRVKKQAAEAEKLQQELIGNPDESASEEIQEPTSAVVEDAATPAPEGEAEKNLVQPEPEANSEELEAKPETDWKKRFDGMKTTYDREVPKLRGELATAHSQVDSLSSQISELKVSSEQLEKTPVAAEPESIVFTDEEREQYGDGYISMMEKVSQQSNAEIVKQLISVQQQLADVTQGQKSVNEEKVVSEEQSFFQGLDSMVGTDWNKINTSQAFLTFLDGEVPYTGKTKMHFLREARKNLDLTAVAGIFNDFKAVSPQGEPHEDEPKSIPEELVTPNSKGGGKPPAPELKFYTSDEVTTFYSDKTKGRYKGKEDEARAIEKDIIAAGQQGRIVSARHA